MHCHQCNGTNMLNVDSPLRQSGTMLGMSANNSATQTQCGAQKQRTQYKHQPCTSNSATSAGFNRGFLDGGGTGARQSRARATGASMPFEEDDQALQAIGMSPSSLQSPFWVFLTQLMLLPQKQSSISQAHCDKRLSCCSYVSGPSMQSGTHEKFSSCRP